MGMSEKPVQVIQILGLGHSGTTLLETLLWEHHGALALGEISAVLHQKTGSEQGTDDVCSCGKQLKTCSFWSSFDVSARGWKPGHEYEFAKEVLVQARARGATSITDSSPSQFVLPAFQKLEREGLCTLKVVYLMRLPQGWIPLFRRMLHHVHGGIKGLWYGFPLRVAHYWYKENRRCKALAESLKVPYLTVSYEQLALQPLPTLQTIAQFASLPAKAGAADPNFRHISYSHRTKFTTRSIKDIVYDTEWFSDWGAQFAVLALPHVRLFARSQVPLPTLPKNDKK
jgi:hypothetical protein